MLPPKLDREKSGGSAISPKGGPHPAGNGEMSPSWLPRSEMFFARGSACTSSEGYFAQGS
ncbi:hypothetical protein B9L23_19155 [Parageobacillus galactosidasius]|uniref:Uncharacterized protein n=1 Tax=Parageobacillus galactosidasius TaxID=883812 RepID=A0A226QNB3_9BACL|nr:hypothetical protein B1689_02525 [Geobacillus sp. 44C]OXB93207.1 hypothetical protein B9L23_19155 [Parageobacillus galactosidasius]